MNLVKGAMSDHFMMLVKLSNAFDTGQKLFIFFNSWNEEPNYINLVKGAWASTLGGNTVCVVQKIKAVKRRIKPWIKGREFS